MDRLAGMLARERRLLQVLLSKLVEARRLALAGEARCLLWATTEVERASRRVREAELHRAVIATGVADDLRVDPEELTLGVLADHAPEPWRTVFSDHRLAFLDLVTEIDQPRAGVTGPPLPSLARFLR